MAVLTAIIAALLLLIGLAASFSAKSSGSTPPATRKQLAYIRRKARKLGISEEEAYQLWLSKKRNDVDLAASSTPPETRRSVNHADKHTPSRAPQQNEQSKYAKITPATATLTHGDFDLHVFMRDEPGESYALFNGNELRVASATPKPDGGYNHRIDVICLDCGSYEVCLPGDGDVLKPVHCGGCKRIYSTFGNLALACKEVGEADAIALDRISISRNPH